MHSRKLSFLLIFSLITILSCNKLDELLTFDVKDSGTFAIPSYTGLNAPVSIPVPTITSSASKTFENNNTHASLVKNVKLKELKLNIESPQSKTFKFLKSIEIYISAEGENEVMLASIYDIPVTIGSELTLDPTGNNLDAFIKKENYSLRTVVEIREIPAQDITVRSDMVFQVTANAL